MTLNDNPQIGNTGSRQLCEALQEDLWVKAVDLQNCGLGDTAGWGWLSLMTSSPRHGNADLKVDGIIKLANQVKDRGANTTLNVVDLRRNKNLGKSTGHLEEEDKDDEEDQEREKKTKRWRRKRRRN